MRVDPISAITDVLKQQETWNLLKEMAGKMEPVKIPENLPV